MYIKEILIRPWVAKKLGDDLEHYKTVLRAFKQNPERNGFHFEPLAGQSGQQELSSIRAGGTARIILCKIDNGVYVVTDVLVNHDYNHVQTLNPGEQEALAQGADMGFILLEEPEATEAAGDGVAVSDRIEFINNQFILLDEGQQRAKEKGGQALPLIISGAPGSGKSSVLLSVLRQNMPSWSNTKEGDPEPKILVLAKSAYLIEKMQQEWTAICDQEFQEPERTRVRDCVAFKTPEMLYTQAHPGASFRGEPEFIDWYKDYVSKQQHLKTPSAGKHRGKHAPKAKGKKPITHAEASLIYQECHSMSGYETFKDYHQAVSQQFSIFPDESKRAALWQVYQAYRATLKKNNTIDVAFEPIELPGTYRFIGVDEAQDLSRLQIRSLVQGQNMDALQQHNLLFNVGDHQRLFGSETTIPFIRTLFRERYGKDLEVSHEALLASYRCPKKIIALANAVLQLKYKAIGGSLVLDKNELPFVRPRDADVEGDIDWLENKAALDALIARQRDNAHFVVITSAAFLDEAIGLFGAERVFTAEQFKGLEARDVLLFHPLGQEGFAAANAVIGERFALTDPPELTKDPAGKGSIRHSSLFNQLFVAVTRAQNNVAIYQPETKARFIKESLHRFCSQQKNPASVKPVEPIASTREEWLEQAQKLRQQGLEAQAKLIEQKWQSPAQPNQAVSEPSAKRPPQKQAKKESAVSSPKPVTGDVLLEQLVVNPASVLEQIVQREDGRTLLFHTPLKMIPSELSFIQYLKTKGAEGLNIQFILKLASIVEDYTNSKVATAIHLDLLAGLLHYRAKDNSPPLALDLLPRFGKDSLARSFIQTYKTMRAKSFGTYSIDEKAVQCLKRLDALDMFHEGQTLLHALIQEKNPNLKSIRSLIKAGADLDKLNSQGVPPLYFAVSGGNVELIKMLLEAKANVRYKRNGGYTLLHLAIRDNPQALKVLIGYCKTIINEKNDNGITALYLAVLMKNKKAVRDLIAAGAEVDIANARGCASLNIAVEDGDAELFNMLLKAGAKIDTELKENHIIFCAASHCKNIQIIETLIKRCRHLINERNNEGMTPLNVAAMHNNAIAVKVLYNHGADINLPNNSGDTPLHLAALEGNMDIVNVLLDIGANTLARKLTGETVLHAAVRSNKLEVVQVCSNACKEIINEGNNKGFSALFLAVQNNRMDMVNVLLAAGADPKKAGISCANTIIALAVAAGPEATARATQFVLKLGHRLDSEEGIIISPIEIAQILGHQDIANLIAATVEENRLNP